MKRLGNESRDSVHHRHLKDPGDINPSRPLLPQRLDLALRPVQLQINQSPESPPRKSNRLTRREQESNPFRMDA